MTSIIIVCPANRAIENGVFFNLKIRHGILIIMFICLLIQYSSDDTQEQSTHSKHKQKSHSHNDSSSSSSSKREHVAESNGTEHDRHKISSKHHSKEDRHHRSRYMNILSNYTFTPFLKKKIFG